MLKLLFSWAARWGCGWLNFVSDFEIEARKQVTGNRQPITGYLKLETCYLQPESCKKFNGCKLSVARKYKNSYQVQGGYSGFAINSCMLKLLFAWAAR